MSWALLDVQHHAYLLACRRPVVNSDPTLGLREIVIVQQAF